VNSRWRGFISNSLNARPGIVSSGRANEREGYIRTRGYKKKSARLRLVYFNQDPLASPLFFLYLRLIFSGLLAQVAPPEEFYKEEKIASEGERKREREKKTGSLARAERAE